MDAPFSPAPSNVSLGEDEWDLISGGSESVGHLSPSAPASTAGDDFDSDGERDTPHHTGASFDIPSTLDFRGLIRSIETFHDITSATDELDEEDAVEDAVLRESDRRVEAALASSLSSTLEPFRQPLPAYLTRSISSSISSGLVLSFPDPLTPSQELHAAKEKAVNGDVSPTIDTAPPTPDELDETIAAAEAPTQAPEESPIPSEQDLVVKATIESVQLSAEPLKEPEIVPAEELVTSKRDVKDLRKIASYMPRKRVTGVKRRLSAGTIAQMLQGPSVSHSWTTSIVLSLLAIMLGSTLFVTRAYVSSVASRQALVASQPSSVPLKTIDTYSTAGLTEPIDPVRVDLPSATAVLETPGAGPSAISSSKAQRSIMSSTKRQADEIQHSSAIDIKPSMDLTSGFLKGVTRPSAGCARPSATPSSFWSQGSGKGKEREVVNVWSYWGEEHSENEQRTFLLDGPSGLPASLGRALQEFKATVLGHPYSFSTELLALSGLDWITNFEQVLDAFIRRIVVQTSSIIQDVTSIVTSQASAIVFSVPVQSARDIVLKHGGRVKDNTKRMARAVHAHHKRARANVKTYSRRMEKALKEHATDLSVRKMDVATIVEGVKAHHERARKNVRKGSTMVKTGLRNVVGEGQRFLVDTFGKPEAVADDEPECAVELV
ncbi:hypothetical protein FRB96_006231 [Tulasnella sp. 330]|nr:hypothetical protein FRB96_006231 [Tulasnella sp. 330]KAG8870432.1 hypothetical protein FRB97_009795 [Tulasnella sp. 331]KAG8872045.1 hypothetical protein FRB98_000317 [Tulasnella sp. 332]